MLHALAPLGVNVLVIDDNSPDGTGEIADRLAGELDFVSVLHRAAEGRARPRLSRRLPARARRRRRLHPRDGLRLLAQPGRRSAPDRRLRERRRPRARLAVRAGRRHRELGRVAPAHLRGAARSTRACCSACAIRDLTGGFKCYRRARARDASTSTRSTRRATRSRSRRRTGRCARASRVVEVPIDFVDRTAGESKMSRAIFLEAVKKVPALRPRRARRGRVLMQRARRDDLRRRRSRAGRSSSTSGRRGAGRATRSSRSSTSSPRRRRRVAFVKLNIDEHPEIAARYEVLSIPTVTLFDGGEPRTTVIGARPRAHFERASRLALAEVLPAGELDGVAVQGQHDACRPPRSGRSP